MSFNLSDFKSQVNNWLRPFSYEVRIIPPTLPAPLTGREISLRTESVVLPSVSFLAVNTHRPYGNGLILNIPYGLNTQEINCIHTVDANGEMLKRFFDWSNYIVNIDGDRKYTARYLDEIVADMIINIYDLEGEIVRVYKLFDAYPLSVNPITMSWSSNEIVKLDVNYRYKTFIVE